jgi:F0F1-type ATP synthase assembly protein I
MRRFGRAAELATQLGVTMGLSASGLVVLGLLVGRWLDARLGTGRLATLAMLLVGAIAGQVAMFRLAMSSTRRILAGSQQGSSPAPDAPPQVGLALRVLLLVVLPAVAGLALGLWLDSLLGTKAVAVLVLPLLGLVAGLVGSLRMIHAARWASDKRGGGCSSTEER